MKQKKHIFTLNDNQQGIFFESVRTAQSVYVSQMCLTFKSPLDYKLFKRAFQFAIHRHEILRSSFIIDKTENHTPFKQIIHNHVHPSVIYYDYTELSSREKEKQFNSFLDTDFAISFDFTRAPLMRLAIIRCEEHEYRVIWTRHHILLDGPSVTLVLIEWLTIYNSLLHQETCKLAPPCSFSLPHEFVVDKNEAAYYWRQQLKKFSMSTFLPGVSRKNTFTKNFSRVTIQLTRKDYQKLSCFTNTHKLTTNSILQAVWGIVLSHYSDNKHVIFGSVRAYPKEAVKNCVGLFINTLPMALTVHTEMHVLTFLKLVREQGKALRERVYTSLSDIRKWCGLALDELLYQSIVDYKPYSLNKLINTTFKELKCETSLRLSTPYPLVLEVVDEGDCLDICLNYATDLFTQQYAQNILIHFQEIIKRLYEDAPKRLGDLPTLSSDDKQTSVIKWNETKRDYPLEKLLHQVFEEQVQKTPQAIALIYKNHNLTYEILNKKANQLAHYLIEKRVKPEKLIAILTMPTVNMIISVLAVLKAGGAYMPIDISYPIERVKHLLNDSGAELIIYENKTNKLAEQILQELNKQVMPINVDTLVYDDLNYNDPKLNLSSSNLAYVIYTSGSTGVPKGVMVEHQSVVNMALGCIERLIVTPESRILQIASLGFDVAVAEWSIALLSGASLCLIDKEIFDPNAIVEALEIYRITTIILASSILTALPRKEIPSLKVIAVGGEPCSHAVIDFWAQDRLFLNVYGITETTVCSTIATCCLKQPILSIGTPLPNTQIYILNKEKQPLPIGVYGEIYIGGSGVARGYWNNTALSQKKFTESSFIGQVVGQGQKRIYRTGDKGRWLAHGELEFLGRIDDQVKIMGIRTELLEIEQAIERQPDVEKAAVILKKPQNKQLWAFVLPKTKCLNIEQIRLFLKDFLPRTLLPHQYIIIDKFPLTSHGKIDKDKLDSYCFEKKDLLLNESLTVIEKIIASTIKKITDLKSISVNKNFLDIGLKSMDLVELSAKLSMELNQEISVISLFKYPTIKQLACYAEELNFTNPIREDLIFKKLPLGFKPTMKTLRVNFDHDNKPE